MNIFHFFLEKYNKFISLFKKLVIIQLFLVNYFTFTIKIMKTLLIKVKFSNIDSYDRLTAQLIAKNCPLNSSIPNPF